MKPITLLKCLADNTRLNTTLLLHMQGELCVCELMYALDESQPKISRHLALLRTAGLLNDVRRGQWVYYSINKDLEPWLISVLDSLAEAQKMQLTPYIDRLSSNNLRLTCC